MSKCGSTSMKMSGGRGRSQRRQRQQKRGRHQRGGVGNAASSGGYSDGASYVKSVYGDGNQQWDNVFVKGSQWGNQIVSLDGSQPSSPLSFYNSQKGGRARGRSQRRQRMAHAQGGRSMRRQRGQTRSRKGGFFGAVLQDALVPFGLFAAQNAYGKRTRKHRKH